MNPGFLVLAGLSAAGLAVAARWPRLGEVGRTWAILGVAAMALLWPSLTPSDAIPSAGALVAQAAPWNGSVPADGGNPAIRDVAFQIQPWQLFARREIQSGRWPFWNPHQYAGTPLWANGQVAALSPSHLPIELLPPRIGFLLSPWLRLVVGGLGIFLLARSLGLGLLGARLAALLFPLSGMPVAFLLYPLGGALLLVPWVLWATARVVERPSRWPLLALTVALQLLSGHPETELFTALLSGLFLLFLGGERPWASRAGFVAGWVSGAALAAVQIVPFALLLPATGRWSTWEPAESAPLALVAVEALRILLPDLHGNPARGTWWGPFNYLAMAAYASAFALPLAAAALPTLRRERPLRALVLAATPCALAAYHLPGFWHLLSSAPLYEHLRHHRFRFALVLALVLLAGRGLDRWAEGKGRWSLAGAAVVWIGLGLALWTLGDAWRLRGLFGEQIRWIAWGSGVALALVLGAWIGSRLSPPTRRRIAATLPLLAAVELVIAHGVFNPGLSWRSLYPKTGAVAFLEKQPERLAGQGIALLPNGALVHGLYDVRGDDPVRLAGYDRLYYRWLGPGTSRSFTATPVDRWDSPWLDRLGVRWIVAGPAEAPARAGWSLAYQGADARVYERPSPSALVRPLSPPDEVAALPVAHRPAPDGWSIRLSPEATPRGLVIAEAYERGWRAAVDGRGTQVRATRAGLLRVDLPVEAERIELRYRPPGIVSGAALSGLALALLSAWMLVFTPAPGRHPKVPTP